MTVTSVYFYYANFAFYANFYSLERSVESPTCTKSQSPILQHTFKYRKTVYRQFYLLFFKQIFKNFPISFMIFLFILGGVNVDVPALTLSDPLESSSAAQQTQGHAGLNLLAAALATAWLTQ